MIDVRLFRWYPRAASLGPLPVRGRRSSVKRLILGLEEINYPFLASRPIYIDSALFQGESK